MNPKLRPDVTFYAADDGAVFHSAGKWLKLGGRNLHTMMLRLAPFLDGRRSLEELQAGMDAPRAARLQQLIDALSEHHLVTDAALERPHHLSAATQQLYGAEIAFLDAQLGSGAARFEHFRQQQIAIYGHPELNVHHAAALAQLGVVDVFVCPPPTPEQTEWWQAVTAPLRAQDPDLQLSGLTPDRWCQSGPAPRLIILTALGERPPALPLPAHVSPGILPVMVCGDKTQMGPAMGAAQWALRRASWAASLEVRAGGPGTPLSRFWSPQTASYISNLAAFELMKWCCADEPRSTAYRLAVDLETFQTEVLEEPPERVASLARGAGALTGRLAQLADQPSVTAKELSRRAVQLIGPRHPVEDFGEFDLPQLPLHLVEGRLSGGQRVRGEGLTGAEARMHCLAQCLDALYETEARRGTEDAWQLDLVTQRPVQGRGLSGQLAVSCGATWPVAVTRALLRLYLMQTLAPGSPGKPTAAPLPPGEDTERLQHLLALSGRRAALWQMSNPLGVPIFGVDVNGERQAVAIGPVPHDTARAALLSALAGVQVPPSASTPALTVCGGPQEGPLPGLSSALQADLLTHFSRHQSRLAVLPVPADPVLMAVMPFAAAVTLQATEAE